MAISSAPEARKSLYPTHEPVAGAGDAIKTAHWPLRQNPVLVGHFS